MEEAIESMDAMDANDTETITLVRNKSPGDIYLLVWFSKCLYFISYLSGAR